MEDYKYLGVHTDSRLNKDQHRGWTQEGDEQTLVPKEAKILQPVQLDVGYFLSGCCCKISVLCCGLLERQHRSNNTDRLNRLIRKVAP